MSFYNACKWWSQSMNFRDTVKSFYRCDVTEVFLPSILGLIESFCMYNILGIAKSLYNFFWISQVILLLLEIIRSFYFSWDFIKFSCSFWDLSCFCVTLWSQPRDVLNISYTNYFVFLRCMDTASKADLKLL